MFHNIYIYKVERVSLSYKLELHFKETGKINGNLTDGNICPDLCNS